MHADTVAVGEPGDLGVYCRCSNQKCRVLITPAVATPSVIRGGGYCRACRAEISKRFPGSRRHAGRAGKVEKWLWARLRSHLRTSAKYQDTDIRPAAAHKKEWLGMGLRSFLVYLEDRFLPGMTWDNRREWEIDHIRPLADFDLRDPEQLRVALHYTNQRPMWKKDHLQKTLQEGLNDLRRRFGPKEETV